MPHPRSRFRRIKRSHGLAVRAFIPTFVCFGYFTVQQSIPPMKPPAEAADSLFSSHLPLSILRLLATVEIQHPISTPDKRIRG